MLGAWCGGSRLSKREGLAMNSSAAFMHVSHRGSKGLTYDDD